MDLDLRHHRHAVTLAEHRHFQRAAKALGISQPALSRSIQALEERAGAKLFARTRDGADPTDIGRVYLAKARNLLAEASELAREMLLIRGLEIGELRIGAGVYPAEMFVARAIARMVQAHPSVKITAISNSIDTLLQMLRRREVDLVIGDLRTAETEPRLRVTPLAWHTAHFTVRAGHPILALPEPKLRDALRYPLAFTTRVPPDLLSHLLQGQGAKRSGHSLALIGCDSPTMMKSIASECDAVTLMPVSLIAKELADGTLVTLPIEAPWLGRTFAIIELEERVLSPSAERFLAIVREADAEAAKMSLPVLGKSSQHASVGVVRRPAGRASGATRSVRG
jgi:DNA-binding transcriptional LysR family regulator